MERERAGIRLALVIGLTLGAVPGLAVSARGAYDPGPGQPYGRPNPDVPVEMAQFAFLIGQNDCTERTRGPAGGDWREWEP